MGKFKDATDADDRDYDPARFAGDGDGIEPLSNSCTEDRLSDEDRAANAEHDKLMEELRRSLRDQDRKPA